MASFLCCLVRLMMPEAHCNHPVRRADVRVVESIVFDVLLAFETNRLIKNTVYCIRVLRYEHRRRSHELNEAEQEVSFFAGISKQDAVDVGDWDGLDV